MPVKAVTPILNVSSISESFRWFEQFGWQRGFAWNDGGMIANNADFNENGDAGFTSVCSREVQIFCARELRARELLSCLSSLAMTKLMASGCHGEGTRGRVLISSI
jgi:hypothetical protein